jgi:integrase
MREKYYLKQDRKAFFYPEEWEKILDVASDKQKFTFNCLLHTGARINEIRNIISEDIEHQRKNLILRVTKVRAKLGEKRPSPRIIPLSSWFYKYLKNNINNFKILSTDATGNALQMLSKKINKSNWKDISAHNLRKTFGCWMLALNVDGFKIAQHLGHTPDMLRTHYASPDIFNYKDKEIMREVLDDLPARLRGES